MSYKDLEENRAHGRAYYHSHKEQCNQYSKAYAQTHKEQYWAYRQRIRLEGLIHYSTNPPVCAHCGETDIVILCFDHINNDGAKQRKEHNGNKRMSQWLLSNNYPEGFQVLCHNCNARKEFERRKAKALQT